MGLTLEMVGRLVQCQMLQKIIHSYGKIACNPEINWNIGSTQWEVQAVNSWTNIGEHSGCLNTLPTVLGCTNPQANNYDPSANSDDGSCIVPSVEINNPSNSTVTSFNSITVQYLVNHFRVGTPDPLVNGHIHYFRW